MKIKALSLAMGAGLAMMASQSFALLPTVTPNFTINISGASAQQKTLGALLASFCQAGTLDRYYDNGGTLNAETGALWRSYFCTLSTTNASVPTSLRGQNVLFNNRSKGGSVWGVVPVARNQKVEFLNIGTAVGGACTDRKSVV